MAKGETEEAETISIYEESSQAVRLVCVNNSDRETVRLGKFLKPRAANIFQAVKVPNTPLLSEVFSDNQSSHWASKVTFRGLHGPQVRWVQWVKRLEAKHESTWKQSKIDDAIMNSTYKIKLNRNLILGLAEFWCSETNTFVFPWGEATVTLEDVMINGGFSVIGEPVRSFLKGEMLEIEKALEDKRKELRAPGFPHASHTSWLNHFIDTDIDEELQHAAFLSLWLSRYVFPSRSDGVVRKETFPLAIHFSKGKKMALAPAVLACIYRNLTELKQRTLESLNLGTCMDSIVVSGPLHLVQIWAFERFKLLGPQSPNMLKCSLSIPIVRYVVKSAKNFRWRPLRNVLNCTQAGEVVFDPLNLDEELHCCVRCMQVSELVGLPGCREKYMPHRVAKQFGMDQDLPGKFSSMEFRNNKKIRLFIASKFSQPGVTVRYLNWWRQSKLSREVEIQDKLSRSVNCTKGSAPSESRFTKAKAELYSFDLATAVPGEGSGSLACSEEPKESEVSLPERARKMGDEINAMGAEEDSTPEAEESLNNSQIGVVSWLKTSVSQDFSYEHENLHVKKTGTRTPEAYTPDAGTDLADSVKFNFRKRKRSAPSGSCSSEVSKQVKTEDGGGDHCIAKIKEVKRECNEFGNPSEDYKSKVSKSSAQCDAKIREKEAAGGSSDNPIEIDDNLVTSTSKALKESIIEEMIEILQNKKKSLSQTEDK